MNNAIQQCLVFSQGKIQRAWIEPAETTKNRFVWATVGSDLGHGRYECESELQELRLDGWERATQTAYPPQIRQGEGADLLLCNLQAHHGHLSI